MSQKLLDLYTKVAELNGCTPELVQVVINEFWYAVRDEISHSKGNNLLIHKFGNFEIPENSIDKYLDRLNKSYELGNMTKRRYDKGVDNLLKIKEMANKNKSDDV